MAKSWDHFLHAVELYPVDKGRKLNAHKTYIYIYIYIWKNCAAVLNMLDRNAFAIRGLDMNLNNDDNTNKLIIVKKSTIH